MALFSAEEKERLAAGDFPAPAAVVHDLRWHLRQGAAIFLFGGGIFGQSLARSIRDAGGDLAGFFDNNPALWGMTEVRGIAGEISVFNPARYEKVLAGARNPVVLPAILGYEFEAIRRQCEQIGLPLADFTHYPFVPRNDAALDPGAEAALELFADAASRDLYRLLVRKHSGLDGGAAVPCEGNQYFIEGIPHECYAHFVDVGAFTGSTLGNYLKRFGQTFLSYNAVEANPGNYAELTARYGSLPGVSLFNLAAGDAPGTVYMTDKANESQIADDGDVPVRADRLDTALGDRPVTYVKMDIEGAEPEALRGAGRIFREQKPAAGISVYHDITHFWRVPLMLRDFCPGYRFALRHHSRFAVETVCYAIPGGR